MADRDIRVRFVANVQQYRAALAQAEAQTRQFGREITGQGKATSDQIEQVGRSALIMSGAMAAGLGLSAKAAVDWESSFAGVEKTVNGTAEQMAGLEAGLREMATELPATHSEIAGVAEAAGQLGVKVSDVEGFTRTMVDLGETTNLSAEQAATSLARLSNIMGTSTSDVDRMGSTIVELGNNSATTEAEIVELGTRLAAAGQIAGLSEADVLAFASTLTSVGVEAEAGGTALSKVFTSMRDATIDGGDALETFAQVAGTTASEFAASFRDDPATAIAEFIDGLGRMNASGQSTTAVFEDLELTDQRLMRALLSTAEAGGLLADQIAMAGNAWDENNALQTEAEKRYQTTAAQMEILRNKAADLGIDIGSTLLPALTGSVDVAGDMIEAFAGLPDPVKNTGVALGVVTTAGLGVVGLMGTFGPKIREGRAALEAMGAGGEYANRQLGRLGRFAARAGAYAAAFVVLGQALSQLTDIGQPEDLSGWIDELELLARTGSGFDFGPVITALDEIADPSVGENIGATTSRVVGFVGSFAGIEGTAKRNEERIKAFDEALASMVSSGQADLAATAFNELQTAAEEQGVSIEEVVAAFPAYATAVELAGAKASDGEEPIGGLTGELADQEAQIEETINKFQEYSDALRGTFDPLFAAQDAINGHAENQQAVYLAHLKVAAAQDEVNRRIREHGPASDEAAEAVAALTEAEDDLESKNRDLIRSAADQEAAIYDLRAEIENGTVSWDTAVAKLDEWEQQGVLTADQAKRARDELGWVALAASNIPERIAIDINVNRTGFEQALRDLTSAATDGRTRISVGGGGGLTVATGGYVTPRQVLYRSMGGPSGTDTVPAWLTPGEYVMNRSAVQTYGVDFMQSLNQGRWQPSDSAPAMGSKTFARDIGREVAQNIGPRGDAHVHLGPDHDEGSAARHLAWMLA